ncbi:MAG TPA: serine/threonine-protein kinase, partial [Polyangiaceae bacterium]
LELICGADLRALSKAVVERGDPIPDAVAVHIACALLRALAAVQRALPGLVHRDVTPHNVLVSREGEIKLTDFGIALAMNRARRTHPRVVKGKYGYMAPEQLRGRDLDVRADMFSVGVVLFEMLAGRRPWFSAETADELTAIERGEIASLLECRPDLPPGLAAAVDRMLALDRRDRYADCDAALRAIAHFSAGETGSLRLASLLELAIGSESPDAIAKVSPADRTQTSPGPGLARAAHGPSSGAREGSDPTVRPEIEPRRPKRASSR